MMPQSILDVFILFLTAYLLSQRLLILLIVTVELLKRYFLPFVPYASAAVPISTTVCC